MGRGFRDGTVSTIARLDLDGEDMARLLDQVVTHGGGDALASAPERGAGGVGRSRAAAIPFRHAQDVMEALVGSATLPGPTSG